MQFSCKVYLINKGKNSLPAYKAILKRSIVKNLGLSINDAVILKYFDIFFPTVISKVTASSGYFVYSFTIPRHVGKMMQNRDCVAFSLISIGKRIIEMKENEKQKFFSVYSVASSSVGHPIFVFDIGKDKWIWMYSRGCRFFSLPEKIKFKKKSYSLFELFGAFFCEGLRYRKRGHNLDRLSFSNADPEQIKWFMDACSSLFYIPTTQWTAQILFPEKELTKVALSTWLGVGLSRNQIKVCRNNRTNSRCGVCILYISNSTLAEFFYTLYERAREVAVFSRDYSLGFFRGISRGDIGIILKKGRISVITFSTELKEDTEFFISLSKMIGIKTSKPYFGRGCWNVAIHDYDSFTRMARLQAITHRSRKIKFLNGFLNSSKNVTKKYLDAVAQGKTTTKGAANLLGVSNITSRFYLFDLYKQKYLTRTKSKKFGAFHYLLSDKGEEILNFHRSLIQEVNGHEA